MSHRLALPEEAFLSRQGIGLHGSATPPCTVIACLNSIALQSDALARNGR
jgi:hypothetical protein